MFGECVHHERYIYSFQDSPAFKEYECGSHTKSYGVIRLNELSVIISLAPAA